MGRQMFGRESGMGIVSSSASFARPGQSFTDTSKHGHQGQTCGLLVGIAAGWGVTGPSLSLMIRRGSDGMSIVLKGGPYPGPMLATELADGAIRWPGNSRPR